MMFNSFYGLDIYVTDTQHFHVKLIDPSTSYGLTFTKETEVNRWLAKCDMSYYQNQVNFAVYCATTLCGLPDLKNVTQPLIKAVYQFHFYYQVSKILKKLEVPLPTDNTFNSSQNNINVTEFVNLCNEFGIPSTTDFRTKKGDNNGLGTEYFMGYAVHGNGYIEHRNHYALPDKHYTFAESLHIAKIQRIKQDDDGWTYFITPKDKLTQAGIVRLNDSIRTYVYCILSAQAETRTAIIGSFGTDLDAQKQFTKLLEDSINQHADIPSSISRYQKALSDTHTRLDYVIAPGLYIMGSDMVLKIGIIENYNNNIEVASGKMKPGKNDINDLKNTPHPLMKGAPSKKLKLQTNIPTTSKIETSKIETSKTANADNHKLVENRLVENRIQDDKAHETNKFLLYGLIGGIASLVLYYCK